MPNKYKGEAFQKMAAFGTASTVLYLKKGGIYGDS
jgi:hypothetical protein